MSTITEPGLALGSDRLESPPSMARRALSRAGSALVVVVRLAIGMALCAHQVTSILVVGWTFRLMRRRILRGWWNLSPRRDDVSFDEFAASQDAGSTPRLILAEDVAGRLRRPGPRGGPPGLARRVFRLPGALLGGLGANLKLGVLATACTYALTGPACLLWAWSWEYGWNNSFHKGYEQSAVGPLTGLLGVALFIAAMTYLPMAWAHLAATSDPRACFEFGFVRALIRQRPGSMAVYAAVFSLMTLPVSVLRAAPTFFANVNPAWESASVQEIQWFATKYILICGTYVFTAFVVLHLLSARLYRSAVPRLLRREPQWIDRLHPVLAQTLGTLGLLPEAPEPRRRPLVAAVLGTGRRVKDVVLRLAIYGLWFSVVAQIYIVQFFHYQWFLGWMNQALVHLPSLNFLPAGPR